jgi:acetyl-CoA/propionyl-CoA carboxylase, biotin carboxylase, biotin carboxyl carrier protein
VIAHGPDRESARRALVAALDETAILGLTTNVGFLRTLAASEEFRDATIDTAWLDHATVAEPDDDPARVFAAWTSVAVLRLTSGDPHPFSPDGWRSGADPAPVLVELDRPVSVDRSGGRVDDGQRVWQVEEHLAANHTVVLTVDGDRCRAVLNVTAHSVEVVLHGHRHVFEKPDVFADHGPAVGDGSITAPMPGTVLDVRVERGQQVTEGEVLGTMEAMKMELALTAPFAGTVEAVDAKAGEQVALGAQLFLVEQSPVEPPEGES